MSKNKKVITKARWGLRADNYFIDLWEAKLEGLLNGRKKTVVYKEMADAMQAAGYNVRPCDVRFKIHNFKVRSSGPTKFPQKERVRRIVKTIENDVDRLNGIDPWQWGKEADNLFIDLWESKLDELRAAAKNSYVYEDIASALQEAGHNIRECDIRYKIHNYRKICRKPAWFPLKERVRKIFRDYETDQINENEIKRETNDTDAEEFQSESETNNLEQNDVESETFNVKEKDANNIDEDPLENINDPCNLLYAACPPMSPVSESSAASPDICKKNKIKTNNLEWGEEADNLFLDLWEANLAELCGALHKKKSRIYNVMANAMRAAGHNVRSCDMKYKIRSFKTRYSMSSPWPLYPRVHKILSREKTKSTNDDEENVTPSLGAYNIPSPNSSTASSHGASPSVSKTNKRNIKSLNRKMNIVMQSIKDIYSNIYEMEKKKHKQNEQLLEQTSRIADAIVQISEKLNT